MEATSLDNAVEAMLAPEPSEENQSEAVEAAEAPTQDVESEAVEDVAGGDDDVGIRRRHRRRRICRR